MIRVQLDERPHAPQTICVPFKGESAEICVTYYTWTPEELAEERLKRLKLGKAGSAMRREGSQDDAWDSLIDLSTPDKQRALREEVVPRIKAWDLLDSDGEPVPVTEAIIETLLNWPGWLSRFYGGLFDASEGALAKNS